MKRNNKKGFTIVELVIVIAVIGILAAVLIPTFGTIVTDANKTATIQAARTKYSEVTTADLLDDGIYNASAPATLPTGVTYTCVEGKVTAFAYTDGTYTATLDIATGDWSVAP